MSTQNGTTFFTYLNDTNGTRTKLYRARSISFDSSGEIRISMYSIVFLVSVFGNLFVILTIIRNLRMRTVTNVFLLNLSVGDLLLAIFCMPFTLVPMLLRNFIFGAVMCVLIRYLQGKCFISEFCFSLSGERANCFLLRSCVVMVKIFLTK